MSIKQAFFGEHSLTKVAALFPTHDSAESAARRTQQAAGMNQSQFKLVGPPDDGYSKGTPLSRKLEPEQAGIWRTLVRAHVMTGALGAVFGALMFMGLVIAGNVAVASTPIMSLVSILFFGTLFGLLVGGLLTLRPDHARVASAVRRAIRLGRWAVVAHPVNRKQTNLVMHELRMHSDDVVRTL